MGKLIAVLDAQAEANGVSIETTHITDCAQGTGWDGHYTVHYGNGVSSIHTGEFSFNEEIFAKVDFAKGEDPKKIGEVRFYHEPKMIDSEEAKSILFDHWQEVAFFEDDQLKTFRDWVSNLPSSNDLFFQWLFDYPYFNDLPSEVKQIAQEKFEAFLLELNDYQQKQLCQE